MYASCNDITWKRGEETVAIYTMTDDDDEEEGVCLIQGAVTFLWTKLAMDKNTKRALVPCLIDGFGGEVECTQDNKLQ